MRSKVSVSNMALRHLGVSTEINDFDTESSKEAQACRRFYDEVLDQVLRDFAWPFASVIEALALVEEDPNDEWEYSYRYPSGCLKVGRVLNGSGERIETDENRAAYKIGRDSTGLLIFTDVEDAEVEYTMQETDTGRWPADFAQAFSLLLAAMIGPSVAGGDQFKLSDRALQLYDWRRRSAQANAGNEEVPDYAGDSSGFIRSRE